MGQRRQDRLTGEWTIVAPVRHLRPHATSIAEKPSAAAPAFDPTCPFCPGNEEMLPEIITETPAPQPPGWATRVVANKYPIVEVSRGQEAGAVSGYHQVIVETPRHDIDLADGSEEHIKALIEAYREREETLGGFPGIRSVVLFRNHGRRAGASIEHPHSQVIAVDWVPPRIQAVKRRAVAFHKRTGRCLLCDILSDEIRQGDRLIAENRSFAAFVPFAAMASCEIWIVPKRHSPSLTASAGTDGDLASILRGSLIALRAVLENPPYSYAIETFHNPNEAASALHWRLRIVPRVAVSAGFEIEAGIMVNPSLPEADAAALKAAWALA